MTKRAVKKKLLEPEDLILKGLSVKRL